jgi:hypothetical protein
MRKYNSRFREQVEILELSVKKDQQYSATI